MAESIVVKLIFGSHLYGTATEMSDKDFKSVFVPNGRCIALGLDGSTRLGPIKTPGEKTPAGAVEEEALSLRKYLGLLAEGQIMALDMLFAPKSALLASSPVWDEIQANRKRLLTKRSGKYLTYCKTQANKYGIKGSRIATLKAVIDILTPGPGSENKGQLKLKEYERLLLLMQSNLPHIAFLRHPQPNGNTFRYWEVCGKKLQDTITMATALEILKKTLVEYGDRANLASRNEGIDWKALSHAVRVGRQAEDLLLTGEFSFPLPYAEHLVKIKRGEISYAEVATEIEVLLDRVEQAARVSTLPEESDENWIMNLLAETYGREVSRSYWSNRCRT